MREFYEGLDENEEYANVTMKIDVLHRLKSYEIENETFVLNGIKQKTDKTSEKLTLLYKEMSKLKRKIVEEEQKLNHN